ncbi:TonB-dependent receptor [Fulvivirga sp. M361]|uniref:TonB-dependent receptor family protein n=1 Tax=Fulvivirga sp. M361 TaxID=2594266 RepID=UPI00117B8C51|nr:TonB-dependent receptor [Fulvivirga sp. M361]TRX53068.1 TonB-dependent receptor [Fulvivirga sp. M361]
MNRLPVVFYILLSFINHLVIAQEQDTISSQLLSQVVVVGFDGNKRLLETPGAISTLDTKQINAFDQTSVVFPVNTLPGIRFEERSPGSYRVAIRGSSLRAPFGVRNVKVYWNDIPFTRPTGETPLNLLDPVNYASLEIIKGPAGSVFGAGTGGVLNIKSFPKPERSSMGFSSTWGSYGLQRYVTNVDKKLEKGVLSASYVRQQADGYRENSDLKRDNLQLQGKFELDEHHSFSASLLYSDINYGIPGGLTEEQFKENPRQLRPNLAGRATGLASQNLLIGFTNAYQWNEKFRNTTTVYGNLESFENTFIDFRRESRQNGGGRTRFLYTTKWGRTKWMFILGGEFQRGTDIARNFENNQGQPGALNFDDEIRTTQYFFFAKSAIDLPGDIHVTLGLSRNKLEYDVFRLTDVALDSSFRLLRSFEPQWIPRLGIVKEIDRNLSIHASFSKGFSPPVVEEIRTNEGSLNTDLQPETGANYELGIRGNIWKGKLNIDVTGFYFRLDETIIQEETERGTVVFNNAGNTDQLGVELQSTWYVYSNANSRISNLVWQIAYTYHDFRFDNYINDGEDFSGNDLTGVAPHTLSTTLTLSGKSGWYTRVMYNHNARIPLNDNNTVFADNFHLLLLKAGYRIDLPAGITLDIFGGVNNLTNERYSLGNDLNAFGERYFQPAADRNYYAGLKINLGY